MSNKKVWFITGAGRGMGLDIARAALAAGYKVVAVLQQEINPYRDLSTSLAYENA